MRGLTGLAQFFFKRTSSRGADQGQGSISIRAGFASAISPSPRFSMVARVGDSVMLLKTRRFTEGTFRQ